MGRTPPRGRTLALYGGTLTTVAAFLPWIRGHVSVTGVHGDGLVTLAFAFVVLGVVLVRSWDATAHATALVVGVLDTLLAGAALGNVLAVGSVPFPLAPGTGLLLTLAGGGTLVVAGLLGVVTRRAGGTGGNPEA